MRIRLILVAVIGSCMFLACVALWTALLPRKVTLDRARMEQIEEGMTREEVEAVLGVPPGVYTDRQFIFFEPPSLSCIEDSDDWILYDWICDDGELFVLFDWDGRARPTTAQARPVNISYYFPGSGGGVLGTWTNPLFGSMIS